MDSLIQPHVLVLDPNPATSTLLAAMLRRSGLRVTSCGSERDAAAHCLRRARYAVVILSCDMPGVDALLRELRVPVRSERPKIILATTSDAAPHTSEADIVLLKPFDLAELYAAVASCCGVCGDDRSRLQQPPRATATAG